ncbi:MAG: hypothetical protein D8M58_17990 [Calditrichaeota bacterium]|nr:MAG: hypothetical protein DWQ03_11220 [Calditrichota bacterium]MBL1207300.1 hypothetical protein [Calditrichota bacterium]NOG47132.1 ABC transporter permease [Calditrichota bacterium]
MLKLIIFKELKDIISSSKFAWTFAIISFLTIMVFYVSGKNYELQQRRYEAGLAENTRQMQGITDWLQIKHHIYLPPDPLYTLVNGIDNDIGRNTEMFGVGELVSDDSRYMEDPLFATFRFLDLRFLFVIIFSLFAIMFGYNMINGEKESGTLKLVFANSIPKDTFVLGKMIGAISAIAIPVLLPLSIGSLLLIFMGIPMEAESWLRLAFINFAGILLFVFFLVLSILFSALTKKSSWSFLYMIVIWIFFVLIWPRSSVLISGRAVDVPSVDEVAYQKAAFQSQLWQEDRKKMNNYKPDTQDMSKMMEDFQKFMAEISDERNTKMAEYSQRLNQERQNRQVIQESTAFWVGRLSPVTEFALAAMQLAGTNIDLKNRYREEAKRYQETYAGFLKQHTGGPLPGGGIVMRMVGEEEPEPIDPSELPVYQFKKSSLSEDMSKAAIDFGLLISFILVGFASSVWAFSRFDVR